MRTLIPPRLSRLSRMFLASAGAALAVLAPRHASAQADMSPHLPNVLLLLDTSGSMEYLIPPDPTDPNGQTNMTPESPNAAPGAQCLVPGTMSGSSPWSSTYSTSVQNRWATLVSTLTGSFSPGAFGCEDLKRNSSKFVSEYSLPGGGNPYDYNYYLDWHRIYSNGCTVGAYNAAALPANQNWTSWPTPFFDFHTSAGSCFSNSANCCQWTGQFDDGILDTFSGLARFGLMTFDSFTDPSTGNVAGSSPPSMNASGAMKGMWSYFHNWQTYSGGSPTVGGKPAAGNPAGCTTPQFFEVGARNPAAPPWEGPLTPFGDPMSDANTVQNNTNIQWEILAMRPYGGTPIAGMLDDANEFLFLDHSTAPNVTPTRDFGPYEDPYWVGGCRKTYVILLTDGAPNLDLRGPDGMCDQSPPTGYTQAGACPYLPPETTLTNMRLTPPTGNANQSVTTFVVGFAISNPSKLPNGDTSCSQINPLTDCVNPAPNIQTCCELQKLAVAGGGPGSVAYFADNPAQLKVALSTILSQIVGSATARTTPVYSTAPPFSAQGPAFNSSTTGASSYEFAASFNVSSSPGTGTLANGGDSGIWTGNLVRERYICGNTGGGLQPAPAAIDQTAGDDYAYNIDYPDRAREFFTVIGATTTNAGGGSPTINSDWTIRPYIGGTTDGFGTYAPDSGTPTTLMTDATFPTVMQGWPNAFGIQTPSDANCAGAFGFGSPAAQCVNALLTWEVGGTNSLAPAFTPAVSRDPASAYCQAKHCPPVDPNNPASYGCACHKLGAIYHSTPAVIGPPNESLRDDSYVAYANDPNVLNKPFMLYTASIDGQLHAFKVSASVAADTFTTDKAHNNELWSFIPPAVQKHILPNFNTGGANLLDGPPVVVDVPATVVPSGSPPKFERNASQSASQTTWRRVLVSGGGAGGGFYYALDVTDPTVAPKFLWQISTDGAGHPIFGVTTPKPAVTIVAINESGVLTQVPVAILPGGSGALAASACTTTPPHPATTGIVTKNANNPNNVNGSYLPLDVHNLPPLRCWAGNTVYDVGTNHSVGNNNGAASTGNSITIVRLDTGAVLAHFTGAGYWGASGISNLQGDDGNHDTGGTNGNVFSTQPFTAPMTGTPVAYPSNVGAIADHAYVGDADGQLWRIDLSAPTPAQWTVGLAWDAYIDSPTSKREIIELPPVTSRDAFGNVVIELATGNQTLLTAQATDTRVWSLTETPSQVAGQKWSVSQNWYIPFPAGTQHVTGPMEVFNGGLYFATYSPQPTGSNVCAPNSAAVWGVDYVRPQTTPAGSPCTNNLSPQGLPLPAFQPTPGVPPVFCQSTATPDNTVIFGVSAAETPTCDTAGGSINDPYFGTHNYVSGASQSTYQLKWQTGQGAGLANGGNVNAEKQGSAANPIQHMQSMNLPAPGQQSRIDSWAALVE